MGRKCTIFALFYFVFECKFQLQAPGGLYSEGRFNGGFFALRSWGAYIWRGLYIEGLIFGILRYSVSLLNRSSFFPQSYARRAKKWSTVTQKKNKRLLVVYLKVSQKFQFSHRSFHFAPGNFSLLIIRLNVNGIAHKSKWVLNVAFEDSGSKPLAKLKLSWVKN